MRWEDVQSEYLSDSIEFEEIPFNQGGGSQDYRFGGIFLQIILKQNLNKNINPSMEINPSIKGNQSINIMERVTWVFFDSDGF